MKFGAFLLFLCCFLSQVKAQFIPNNSYKIIAGETGLGGSFEYNPVKGVYLETQASSFYRVTRLGIQAKYCLYSRNDNFYIKEGMEGDYILNIDTFMKLIPYNNWVLMTHISVELGEIGVQMSTLYNAVSSGRARNVFARFTPILSLTLNITRNKLKGDKLR